MKVAYLFGSLNRGGAETLVLDVFKNASKAPYAMVGVHRKGGAYQEEFYAAGPKMIQCTPKRFRYLSYLWRLRKCLLRERVTIVHAQYWLDALYARLATIGLHMPIILTFHGHSFADASWWLRKATYHMNKKIICVSEYQKHYYECKWKLPTVNKLEVVYNGIDFTKIDKGERISGLVVSGLEDEREKGLKGERIKLCMVGNFVKGRSQIVIARALARLDAKRLEPSVLESSTLDAAHLDFYFIGRKDNSEPERYDECVKYCEEKGLKTVHFMGGRGDVPELLRQMDGFVYATRNDTFGIAVVEAIAAGLPVVVNDWPVMKEVCGEANAGVRYFKTDDCDDAAAKIATLLEEMDESKQEAKENAKIVRLRFSIEQHITNLNRIYKSL